MTWPHGQGIWISKGINSHYDTPELKVWFSNGPADWFCPHTTNLTSWQKCGISRDLFLLCLLIGQWHYQSWNPVVVGQLSFEQDLLASCELNLNLRRRFAGQEYCWCFQSGQWDHWRYLLSRWLTPNSKASTVRMVMRRDHGRKSGQGSLTRN